MTKRRKAIFQSVTRQLTTSLLALRIGLSVPLPSFLGNYAQIRRSWLNRWRKLRVCRIVFLSNTTNLLHQLRQAIAHYQVLMNDPLKFDTGWHGNMRTCRI